MVANIAFGGESELSNVEALDFADVVKLAQFSSGMTAAAFARRLETAPETLQNWREGISTPTWTRVIDLSKRRLLPTSSRRSLMLLIGDGDFVVIPYRALVGLQNANGKSDQASVLRLLVEAERAGCDARHLMQEAMADGVVTPLELEGVGAAVARKESLLRRAWESFCSMCRTRGRA